PYLYLASQLAAGLAGCEAALDPGPGAEAPYAPDKPLLPASLGQAVEALAASEMFVSRWGRAFMDYYVHLKRAELARFGLEVTEWEQREYFDMF
ncbi:MAG: glutamine synthetase, partial [Burkholderiaceae bacterium]